MDDRYIFNVATSRPMIIRLFWYSKIMAEPKIISDMLPDRPVLFIISNAWSLAWRYAHKDLHGTFDMLRAITTLRPQHRFLMLGNSQFEADLSGAFGIHGVSANHNIFLNKNTFYIKHADKTFNAVYNGRLTKYKRIELVKDVDNVCLAYASSDKNFRESIKDIVAATFTANEADGEYRTLNAGEIVDIYCKSRVGLCLSAIEGGMMSAGEYMLCGLPVVSTCDIGGRSSLFSPSNALIVDATPAAVADGVRKMIAMAPSPHAVRGEFLRSVAVTRTRLVERAIALMSDVWGFEEKKLAEDAMLDLNRTFPTGLRPLSALEAGAVQS